MDFHQSASERFAEQVFKYIIKEFDGKTINTEECNLDLMINNLPEGFDDFDLEECLPQVTEENNNEENLSENTNINGGEPEVFQDNIDSPKKKKEKKKKENKKKDPEKSDDNPDKPKRKPNAFIVFRTDPANLDAIIEKANETNEETGKKYGKVKAAGILWKGLTEEEQAKWK